MMSDSFSPRKLKVQEHLLNGGTLNDLKEQLGISVSDYEDRVVLKDSQIESPKHHPIVKECRGLILRKGTWDVLSFPFMRFFNDFEDQNISKFNVADSEAMEKIDGSCITVYHDDEKWCAQTNKMAFAEGQTRLGNTYLSVFERALGCNIESFFKDHPKEFSYTFEVVSPETRVVKPYGYYGAYILMIRDKKTFEEVTEELVFKLLFPRTIMFPKRYRFKSFDDIKNSMSKLPSAFDEGYRSE